MHSEIGYDQAEGLRRMLVRGQSQVVTIVAGKTGVGRTSSTINFAAALARSGKDVLVLDENHAPNNLLDRLGLKPRRDLLDVVQDRCSVRAALLRSHGFQVLPTARAIHALAHLSQIELQRLEDALTEVSDGVDVILVDAAMLVGHAVSTSLSNEAKLVVVMDATVSGITESYALIKRLALENARLQFEIVVNKVVNQAAALTVFDNMAKVARTNLAARLVFLGFIPFDERLQRATLLGRAVLDAFPQSASAQAYLALSQRLLHTGPESEGFDGGIANLMGKMIRQLHSQVASAHCP
jgi:flagellar biosynthesis protein FlhG